MSSAAMNLDGSSILAAAGNIAAAGAAAHSLYNMAAGGGPPPNKKATNNNREPVITSNAYSDRVYVTNKRKNDTAGVSNSIDDVITNDDYFDKSMTLIGEHQMSSLKFVAGPKLYPDHFKHFMKQFQASGVTRTSWAGRVLVPVGERRYHHQVFRHNLSTDDSTFAAPADYPTAFKSYILYPSNPAKFYPATDINGNPPVTAIPFAPNTQPFRDMTNGAVYWSPDNRSDLEDMSWNANRFKPSPIANATTAVTLLKDDVPTFVPNAHARKSAIYVSNEADAQNIPSGEVRPAGWQWKACINEGHVNYNFMNKGLGPAKVEMILWKVKKTHLMSARISDYEDTYEYPAAATIKAIQEGWCNNNLAIASTEKYDGRVPSIDDVTINPRFPFLPQLKRTRQRNVDFTEVGRQVFALTSGGRRAVSFQLPGEVYNPINIATKTPEEINPFDTGKIPPCMDEHTYMITMAVNGIRGTAAYQTPFSTNPDGSTNPASYGRVGDDFSEANVQFYCSYEEKVGPCVYQPPQNKLLYNHGGIKKPTIPEGLTELVGTMLPQDKSLRYNINPNFNQGSSSAFNGGQTPG